VLLVSTYLTHTNLDGQPEAQLTDLRETDDMTSRLALTTLHDVEEDIWSPTYGLKGKLDASVQVLIEQKKEVATSKLSFNKPGDSETRTWMMPFEIKTGRSVGVLEHRAQTMLYTLLMAERYGALSVQTLSLHGVLRFLFMAQAWKFLVACSTIPNPMSYCASPQQGTNSRA
jgi:hypothetical protein